MFRGVPGFSTCHFKPFLVSFGLSNLEVVVDEWAGFGEDILISMFQGTSHLPLEMILVIK